MPGAMAIAALLGFTVIRSPRPSPSRLGAGYALHLAGQDSGAPRMLLIGAAVLTVVLSWAVINTVYTLRYAGQHFRSKPGGIAFGAEDDQ